MSYRTFETAARRAKCRIEMDETLHAASTPTAKLDRPGDLAQGPAGGLIWFFARQ